MNVFVEAFGLIAIAYATFAVVSFMEIRNLSKPLESEELLERGRERSVTRDEDEFLGTSEPKKVPGRKRKKARKANTAKGRVPRAFLNLFNSPVYQSSLRTHCVAPRTGIQVHRQPRCTGVLF